MAPPPYWGKSTSCLSTVSARGTAANGSLMVHPQGPDPLALFFGWYEIVRLGWNDGPAVSLRSVVPSALRMQAPLTPDNYKTVPELHSAAGSYGA